LLKEWVFAAPEYDFRPVASIDAEREPIGATVADAEPDAGPTRREARLDLDGNDAAIWPNRDDVKQPV